MAVPLARSIVCPILIGRKSNLDTLVQFMEQAYRGHGQIVLISGEAGIGKSRLVAETIRHTRSSSVQTESPAALILKGRCFEPDHALPYAPFLDLLRSFLTTQSPDEVANLLGPTASELIKLLPEFATYLPKLAPDSVLDPEQEKRRLFQALLRFFTHLSTFQPLLVIIEDIHWSDDSSLEFLHSQLLAIYPNRDRAIIEQFNFHIRAKNAAFNWKTVFHTSLFKKLIKRNCN